MKNIRIKRIDPASLSMIVGAFYFIMGILTAALALFFGAAGSMMTFKGPFSYTWNGAASLPLLLFAPVIYGFLGMLFGYVFAWIYNFIAKFTRGLLLEVTETIGAVFRSLNGWQQRPV
jgi:hypothetical protein